MEYFQENYELNFGKVVVGKVYKKTFVPPKEMEIHSITVSKFGNSLETQFQVKLKPNKSSIEVTFTPESSGQHSCNYFFVEYNDKNLCCLTVKGETEDINVSLSNTSLIMLTRPQHRCKQMIKLSNRSKTPGLFEFFFDKERLHVEPDKGTVEPMNYIWITVMYTPEKIGSFYTEVYCFVQYQTPVVLYIKGACNHSHICEIGHHVNFMENIWRGKTGYEHVTGSDIYECEHTINVVPVVVSPKFLDVGSLSLKPNEIKTLTSSFFVTCNTHINLRIKWALDPFKEFSITPRVCVLQPRATQKFEVSFNPMAPDRLCHIFLRATLKWGEHNRIVLPYFTGIQLIGNSFDENVCGWATEYTMSPKIIKMPPTLPNFSCYTTMAIHKLSHVPLMFKFIPPNNTYFEIWPMQGVIHNNFKIFVVKMRAGPQGHVNRKEVWKIKINTSFTHSFEIVGSVEVPIINFFSSLNVTFPPTFLNCYNDSTILMNNPTRLTLRFNVEFKEFEKCLTKIGTSPYLIHCNELMSLSMRFCPRALGEYKTSIFVNPYVFDPNGQKVIIKYLVMVSGSGVLPSFKIVPEKLLCSDTPYGAPSSETFMIKNVGDATAHFSLTYFATHKMYNKVTIISSPEKLCLIPNEEVSVKLNIMADETGYHELEYFAIIHKCDNDTEVIQQIKILDIVLTVVFPMMKIADLKLIQVPQLISKYAMWFCLNIPQLNDALAGLQYQNNVTVYCKAPEAEQNVKPVIVQLLLKNTRNSPCRFKLVNKVSCSCVENNLEVCSHRELVFSPSSGVIDGGDTTTVTLTIHYQSEELEELPIQLKLGGLKTPDMGTVTLIIERFVILENMLSGDLPYPSEHGVINYSLRPVFIGNPYPPIQMIWIYNNTRAESFFDVRLVGKDSRYLNIYNRNGPLKGKTFSPIVVRFLPNELREYRMKMLVTIGSRLFKMNVCGSGVQAVPRVFMPRMPFHSQFKSNFPATISLDFVTVENLSPHSFKKVAVTIKNMSDKLIAFEWTRFVVGGIVNTSVQPTVGDLFPNEILPCLVSIRSYSYPFKVTLSLFCKITFPEMDKEWKDHKKKFSKLAKEVENAFVITDTNLSHAEISSLQTVPEPEPHYLSLSLHIDCSMVHKVTRKELPPLNLSTRYSSSNNVTIPHSLAEESSNLLCRLMWEIFESDDFYDLLSSKQIKPYYIDIADQIYEEKTKTDYPVRCITSLIDDTIYTLVSEMLNINLNWDFNYNILYPLERGNVEIRCPHFSLVNNEYFKDILIEASSTKFSLYKSKTLSGEIKIGTTKNGTIKNSLRK